MLAVDKLITAVPTAAASARSSSTPRWPSTPMLLGCVGFSVPFAFATGFDR